ncbi:hypothetical protein MNBD_GAMMA12-985 [hydrothermal vent metagenome]|uniref:Uncharacterized protein n=1 Tax=hydrothermal vent metagenome TaxID=652676 RepID=A0A3B0YA16_9ZZZZ
MSTTYLAPYWGELKAICNVDHSIYFIAEHQEKYATAVFSIDLEARQVYSAPLPAGAIALCATKLKIWVAGSDRCLYCYDVKKNTVAQIGNAFESNITNIATATDNRLLLTVDSELLIVDSKSAKPLQSLMLPAQATALATDPSGCWIAVGDSSGHVSVFEAESQQDFVLGDKQLFHTGAVTALAFEENELRFFSTGTDRELYLIHARGKLDAEDKGKSYKHERPVTSMLLGHGSSRTASRLYTGAEDQVIKSWPTDSLLQPGSFNKGVGKVKGLCCCTFSENDYLAVITTKNVIQLFELDKSGKVTDKIIEYQDVYAWAKADFSQKEFENSEQSLKRLATLDDSQSVKLIAEQIRSGKDKELKRKAAQLLSSSKNLKSPLLLKDHLNHRDEKIRSIVFDSLLDTNGRDDYQLLNNTLNSGFFDIADKAINILISNAKQDQQALNYLLDALQLKPIETRTAALTALEAVANFSSAKENSNQLIQFLLVALASPHVDIRKLALIRLYHHQLLGELRVQSAVRLTLEDPSIPVRRTAFFVLLHQQSTLSKELRKRDEEFDRHLSEIEQTKPKLFSVKKSQAKVPKFSDQDKHPLLQAMSCRQTDISMLAVHGLALVRDHRALALLLQFSRDSDEAIRVEVCHAFMALKDELSIDRLAECLSDSSEAVRSAAWSALQVMLAGSLEKTLAFGFASNAEDSHQRSMQLLAKMFKATAKKPLSTGIDKFLKEALNDRFESIRSEAFKTVLNQQIDQDELKTHEFLLNSSFVDVRQSVLTELMAEYKQTWAFEKIKDLLNDQDAQLRKFAMNFLLSKSKRKEFPIFEIGLKSRYSDIRMESVTKLIAEPGKLTEQLLLSVIDDKEKSIRQKALEFIVSSSSKESLQKAVTSTKLDIKVRAAGALARLGESVASTFSEVLALEEPKEAQSKGEWVDAILVTLQGVVELEDSSFTKQTQAFIEHKNSHIRKAAVKALIAIVTVDNAELVSKKLLAHEDSEIRYQTALGMAYSGQQQALGFLFNKKNTACDIDRLAASVALGAEAMPYTLAHLEQGSGQLSFVTLCVLLLMDESTHHKPSACLKIISAKRPEFRVVAADALKHYPSVDGFLAFITEFINSHNRDHSVWNIPSQDIKLLALLLTHSSAKMKARVVHLLEKLTNEKQSEWEFFWLPFKIRHQAQITELQNLALDENNRQSYESLLPLIYGTYVGLARVEHYPAFRYNALNSLELLLKQSADLCHSIYPLYLQALNDVDTKVRNLAFDLLLQSDLAVSETCAEALSVKQSDIGIRALQVLLDTGSNETAISIIEQVILSNIDGLELKAAELLAESSDIAAVALLALNAASKPMRRKAVGMLEAEYDSGAAAAGNLRTAFENRYLDVRLECALALNRKHDEFAVKALLDLLSSAEMESQQGKILSALSESGRPEVVESLLQFLINDKRGLANANEIFKVVASFRQLKSAQNLLTLTENSAWFKKIMSALIIISGHDQEIKDADDLLKDKQWIDEQFPRHDALLAKIVSEFFERNMFKDIARLLFAMRWSQTGEVDSVLAKCCLVTDQSFAAKAIAICGWRVLNRKMTAEPLLRALQRPDTQVEAAIALAEAGKNEGIAILLNTVQHEEDYTLRCAALMALGYTADERAVELLLAYAKDKESDVCAVACEAIGYLSRSEYAYEIFELLKNYVDKSDHFTEYALNGLRWFNTEDAWRIIRSLATNDTASYQYYALPLLAYNATDQTRNVLLDLIKQQTDEETAKAAYDTAQRIFESNDLIPAISLLQNPNMELDSYYGVREQLDLVCDKGSAQDILAILGQCTIEIQNEFELALLQRPEIEISELTSTLVSKDPVQASIAANLIGNLKNSLLSDADKKLVSQSMANRLSEWTECRQLAEFDQSFNSQSAPTLERDNALGILSHCLARLCWLAGRLTISQEILISIIEQGVDDLFAHNIRKQAFKALLEFPEQSDITACATKFLTDPDSTIRTLCVEILLTHGHKQATDLIEDVLSDQASINLLIQSGLSSQLLASSASNAHYQGLLLPIIVEQNDIESLAKIVLDTTLDDETRFGAIEGLARMRTELAENQMAAIGQTLEDEDLCRAVWSAKRRSVRARMKMEVKS